MTPGHHSPATPGVRARPSTHARILILRCVALAALALSAAACADDGDYPRDWDALQEPAEISGVPADKPAARTCPAMTGVYRVNDTIIFRHLIARKLSDDQRRIPWYTVELTGSTSDSLRAVLASSIVRDTVWIARGRDFDCSGGWITGTWPQYLLRMWPSDSMEGGRGYESSLAIARDVQGRLIGRMTIVSYREVAVWCGDGCRYAKIPLTRKEMVRWHRMSTDRTGDPDNGETMIDSATNARVLREDQMLEAGTPLPPDDGRGGPGRGATTRLQAQAAERMRRIEAGEAPQ